MSCTTYSSMRAGAAQCVTAPAVSLSEDMDTNTESLTERTINNPFIILFEKTTIKYKNLAMCTALG